MATRKDNVIPFKTREQLEQERLGEGRKTEEEFFKFLEEHFAQMDDED